VSDDKAASERPPDIEDLSSHNPASPLPMWFDCLACLRNFYCKSTRYDGLISRSRSMGSSYGTITVATLVIQDCFVGLLFALMPLFKQSAPVPAVPAPSAATENILASPPQHHHHKHGWGRFRRMMAPGASPGDFAFANSWIWYLDGKSHIEAVGDRTARLLLQENPEAVLAAHAAAVASSEQSGVAVLMTVTRVVLKIGLLGTFSLLFARFVLSRPLKLLFRCEVVKYVRGGLAP